MTYNLFIGANNKTHLLELDKINKIVSQFHEGYTLIRCKGSWHGVAEQSCMVIITVNVESEAIRTAKILRQELNQEAVALQLAPEMRFI